MTRRSWSRGEARPRSPSPSPPVEPEAGVTADSGVEPEIEAGIERETESEIVGKREQRHLPLLEPEADDEGEGDEDPAPTRSITFVDEGPYGGADHEITVTESDRGRWFDEVDSDATMDFPARSKHLEDLARLAAGPRGGQGEGGVPVPADRDELGGRQPRPRRAAG